MEAITQGVVVKSKKKFPHLIQNKKMYSKTRKQLQDEILLLKNEITMLSEHIKELEKLNLMLEKIAS
jgi:hypothetical protein